MEQARPRANLFCPVETVVKVDENGEHPIEVHITDTKKKRARLGAKKKN